MALDLLWPEVAELPRRRRPARLTAAGRALALAAAAFAFLALLGAVHGGR